MDNLDFGGLWNLARQRAREKASLYYPPGIDRNKKEEELAIRFYKQFTTPPHLLRRP